MFVIYTPNDFMYIYPIILYKMGYMAYIHTYIYEIANG